MASTWVKPWQVVAIRVIRNGSPAPMSPWTCTSGFHRKCGSIGMVRSTMRMARTALGLRLLDGVDELRPEAVHKGLLDLVAEQILERLRVHLLDDREPRLLHLGEVLAFDVPVHLALICSRFLRGLQDRSLLVGAEALELGEAHRDD